MNIFDPMVATIWMKSFHLLKLRRANQCLKLQDYAQCNASWEHCTLWSFSFFLSAGQHQQVYEVVLPFSSAASTNKCANYPSKIAPLARGASSKLRFARKIDGNTARNLIYFESLYLSVLWRTYLTARKGRAQKGHAQSLSFVISGTRAQTLCFVTTPRGIL